MYKVTIINDGEETVIHHPDFNGIKAVTGDVRIGINAASGFTFSILPNNPGYNLIRPLKTLINVQNVKTGNMEFEGRIVMPTETMSDAGVFAKSFICEGELSYFNDSVQRFTRLSTNPTARTILARILMNHNRYVASDAYDKTFQLGNVTVEDSTVALNSFIEYDGTLETIKTKLLDLLGGELQIRKENGVRYLDYVDRIGETKPTEIRLAKNLKSIQKEVDPSTVITRLVPLGKARESTDADSEDSQPRVTIAEVNDGLEYIEDSKAKEAFSIIVKTQVWDDVEVPEVLMARGKSFLNKNNRVQTKYSITALDLALINLDADSFEVGNYYPVINPVMGINESLRVIEKNINIINPNQNSLTIGDTFKTASKYLSDAKKSQKTIQQLTNTISQQSTQISTISNDLSTTKQELSTTKQTLESYQSTTGTNLSEVSNQVSSLLGVVEDLQQAITAIESVVSVEQIQLMQQGISNNANGITTINEQLVIINQALEELNQRVTNLESPPTEGETV
ncbi:MULTISPECIES: phage tail spike protein [unclassified Niallia]|uniref:phage tail spike protein n=1 Tax=unclassified Niallia TaxID=2837522 RepID=UPI00203B28E8|nr:phage tail spike protein [Niallia sp. MER 6]MCM3030391.1 phage tail protein [Niallia sp. MER 6]